MLIFVFYLWFQTHIYGADEPLADELERITARYTVSAFATADALRSANDAAKSVQEGGSAEVLKNFLKAI